MDNFSGRRLIIIGFFLVLFGMVMPWLMVMQIVQATFLLSFVSYGASVLGLMFGIIGASRVFKVNRKQNDKDEIMQTDFFRHDKNRHDR